MEEKIGKREKKKEEKWNKMLEVAMEEFASRGYFDVSTDAITTRCGMSKGLLFHYFASKKNLYLTCLETALKRTTYAPAKSSSQEAVKGPGSFYELLWAQFEARMELDKNYPLERRLIEMALKEEAEEVKKEKKELMDKFLHLKDILTARGITEAMDCLPIREEGNPYVRQGLKLYINCVWEKLLAESEAKTTQELKQDFIKYISVMLKGITS